jgi:hypothetical protein
MAKGKFFGFLGKVGKLVGTVIPGAAVAGKLAENAAALIAKKKTPAQKAADEKKVAEQAKATGALLGGATEGESKLLVLFGNVWTFVKKYWYVVLPAFVAVIYLLLFRKKKRAVGGHRVRRSSRTPKRIIRRSSKTKNKRLTGQAFVKKMRLAKLRAARKRK